VPELLAVFPFPHALEVQARLTDGALDIATTLTAGPDAAVPVSFGYHPYLRPDAGPREGWRVSLGARRRVVLDDAGIPTGVTEPAPFRAGALGTRAFDDAFGDLDDPPVFAVEGTRRRVAVRFGAGYAHAQVFSPAGAPFICFEPMTAPVDALVSGTDLCVVPPGGAFTASFTVAVSQPA
jgi:galactose mutarotase-like enzyme